VFFTKLIWNRKGMQEKKCRFDSMKNAHDVFPVLEFDSPFSDITWGSQNEFQAKYY
jgi:hypothetical protein